MGVIRNHHYTCGALAVSRNCYGPRRRTIDGGRLAYSAMNCETMSGGGTPRASLPARVRRTECTVKTDVCVSGL